MLDHAEDGTRCCGIVTYVHTSSAVATANSTRLLCRGKTWVLNHLADAWATGLRQCQHSQNLCLLVCTNRL